MNKQIKRYNKKDLFDLAFYDQVTGLSNEKYFFKELNKKIKASTSKDKFAVLYLKIINIDKLINIIGFNNSNNFINEVADKIKDFCPEVELISLYRGSEFLILLPIKKKDKFYLQMEKRLDNLLKYLKLFIWESGYNYMLKINIGVSLYPIHGKDSEDIISTAHHAMHLVDSENDEYQLYNEELFTKELDNETIKKSLEKSVEMQDFFLYYQPKIKLKSDKITSVEALLRWNHPQRGEISPGKFIPMAEESGFIKNIGCWVLKESFKTLNKWIKLGFEEIKICVNISSIELNDPEIISNIEEISNSYTVPNNLIEFEITERSFADVPENVLYKLKELGFLINLDDFGTGYSSLSYFGRLPIDILKLDKTFIDNIDKWKTRTLVKTVIDLSHKFGVEVVAEGVEDKSQLTVLKKLSCDYIQGYYFYKPMHQKELEHLLAKQSKHLR